MKVRACPRCGTPVRYTCWHPPDDDVASVEMEASQAVDLAVVALEEAQLDAESKVDTVVNLARLVGGQVLA